jgi:hypothetical protein
MAERQLTHADQLAAGTDGALFMHLAVDHDLPKLRDRAFLTRAALWALHEADHFAFGGLAHSGRADG